MQGNGFKIAAIVAFLALSIYYLFPTYQNVLEERKLASMDAAARAEYEQNNYDHLRSVREKSLNLGLDLRGGMHVTLEVGTGALLKELAGDRSDEDFEAALAQANQEAETSNADYVDLFTDALESRRPGVRLSRYFRNAAAGITIRSSNGDVVGFLKQEVEDALTRAVEVVRQRVDRYGVAEPSIQRQGSRRITVEMPGIDDPQRIRDLLRGTAQLSFHLMPEPAEVQQSAARILAYFADEEAGGDSLAAGDTAAASDTTAAADTTTALDVAELAASDADTVETSTGRTFAEMVTPIQAASPVFGAVAERDTAAVNDMLARPQVQALLPPDSRLVYTSAPQPNPTTGEEDVYYLVAVKERVELEGDVVTDARPDFDPFTNAPLVSLSMNSEGASRWSQITGANVGKSVAIVMDDLVYTYPVIQSRIPSGRTQIEGVTRTEAEDIVTVLKSGALPAPVQIVNERTVGASLGARSVRQGGLALVGGFVFVALFMLFYYRTSGALAALALVLNVVFIFGILAAFGATLTLPGVAGIVLTIGMAVDANVLIFERIREEEAAGKTLRAAVSGGFEKALSAIADGNITTFLIGVILYSFGVGPIQGFAVTLMAGIVTSLFSALVVTRLLVDFVVDRRGKLSFG